MEPIKGSVPEDADVLRFQSRRNITLLFKRYLDILQDVVIEHDEAMAKLNENLPSEYVKYVTLADHLTDTKVDLLRKHILDAGNETIRNMEDCIKGFDVRLK